MARYELEVSDRMGVWATKGQRFRPGVYEITDDEIAQIAASEASPLVTVRELGEDERVQTVVYTGQQAPTAGTPLTVDDLAKANIPAFPCVVIGCFHAPFVSQANLDAHMAAEHPDYEAPEPPAPEPDEAFSEGVEEVDEDEEEEDEEDDEEEEEDEPEPPPKPVAKTPAARRPRKRG